MAKDRNQLGDKAVKALLSRRKPGMHRDGGGLYLRIREGANPQWTFRYRLHGRDRWLPLGDPRDTSLAEARKLARVERTKVDAGRDPIAERREAAEKARGRGSFRTLAEDWYTSEVVPHWKNPKPVRRALDNYLLPKLGRYMADEIKPADCSRILTDVRRKFPTTANDLLRHMKNIYAYGIRHHAVEGSPVSAFDASKDAGGQERPRDRALSRTELGQLFVAMRKEPTFGGDNLLLTKLLLSLCVRKTELFAARWDHFDLDGKTDDGPVWHLPDSKTSMAQDIPLSPVVVAWFRVAKEMAGASKFVFPARRLDKRNTHGHVGNDTLNVALARVKHGLEPFTVHDLRRTGRTLLSELGVEPHVAELCLNHKPRGTERVYNRYSYFAERRVALTALADLIVQIEAGESKVVPIRSGKQKASR